MKLKTKATALLALIAIIFSLASCSVQKEASNSSDGYGGSSDRGPLIGSSGSDYGASSPMSPDGDTMEPGGDYGDSAEDATSPSDGKTDESEPDKDETTDNITKPAGLITAGAWNDNSNYEYWKSLFDQSETKPGKFFAYTKENTWGFNSYGRLKVKVSLSESDDSAVAGATVIAKDTDGNEIYSAVTDANGIAYLFTAGTGGTVSVQSGEYTANAEYLGKGDEEISVKLDNASVKKNVIDIMFVVDVTGSMGDELTFLKNELADVINRVASSDKQTTINLALLFYRDSGDSVPFAYYDFVDVTDSSKLAAQLANLSAQHADGGGDYPEAVDEALELAVGKQWNTGATTKLIFHVLDAPPHDSPKNKTTFKAAVETAAEKGIRICPIICSGTGILTEYLMRQAAIYTAGTFIFVTDDSGIGNPHYDPELPNVTVEALNSLLVRLIDGYHTGKFAPAVHWKEEQLNKNAQ